MQTTLHIKQQTSKNNKSLRDHFRYRAKRHIGIKTGGFQKNFFVRLLADTAYKNYQQKFKAALNQNQNQDSGLMFENNVTMNFSVGGCEIVDLTPMTTKPASVRLTFANYPYLDLSTCGFKIIAQPLHQQNLPQPITATVTSAHVDYQGEIYELASECLLELDDFAFIDINITPETVSSVVTPLKIIASNKPDIDFSRVATHPLVQYRLKQSVLMLRNLQTGAEITVADTNNAIIKFSNLQLSIRGKIYISLINKTQILQNYRIFDEYHYDTQLMQSEQDIHTYLQKLQALAMNS